MWKWRRNAPMPYQEWRAFPKGTVVEVSNAYGDVRQGLVEDFWWGYEQEMGQVGEGVIIKAREIPQKHA
jgi:hypothetical protein